jgi:hypothetical protein
MAGGMRSLLAAILVTATVVTAATARADDDSTATKPKNGEPEENWYGWQTLTTDGAALALLLAAGATTQSSNAAGAFGLASLGTYALGGPIVHLTHDRPGTAVGDLVVRVAVPIATTLLGGVIGNALVPGSPCDSDLPCGGWIGGSILGLGAGVLTASIVDAAVFGYEPAAPKPHDEPHQDASRVRIVPSVGLGTVGAVGSF